MQTSVVIISHNEENYISSCIESLLNQTQKPDEIILISHNSTDRTFDIANLFPIRCIKLNGESGPVYARIEGIKNTSKEIILCIDGDSVAQKNWVEMMIKTLKNDNVLAGSYIEMKGTLFDSLSNLWNKYFCVTKNEKATRWLWGASFAFWGKDKEFVIDILKKSIRVSKELKLAGNKIAEDYWLALFMNEIGNIEITNKTYVVANTKELSIMESWKRNRLNHKNGEKMLRLFQKE